MNRQVPPQVPTWWQQPHFLEFKKAYLANDSQALFFIGSGISIWAGLPDWKTLLERIADRYASLRPDDQRLAECLHDLHAPSLDSSSKATNYQKVGSRLRGLFSDNGDDAWRQALRDILDDPRKIGAPSAIHDVLVRLKWLRILTTNYDCLLEAALDRAGKSNTVGVWHPWRPEPIDIERRREPHIIKIHGDIRDPHSQLVLTAEDYADLYEPQDSLLFERTVGSELRKASVIFFLGYSHDDAYFRKLFNRVMQRVPSDNIFALVTRAEGTHDFQARLEGLEHELHLKFITYSQDSNHQELLELLEYLEEPEARDAQYSMLVHARRPTIVMLYCGGTIGSAMEEGSPTARLAVTKKHSRYDQSLEGFTRKLQSWYRTWHNAGNDVQLDILWEILPPEDQVLSENTTPGFWRRLGSKISELCFKYFEAPGLVTSGAQFTDPRLHALLEEEARQYRLITPELSLSDKRFVSDFRNRYILGFVLLFGTDTLAFLASAFSLGLHNLPCSIILTGANQPTKAQSLAERSQFYARSDAWKNLMTSLYFLQCLGHRLTETFVCFSETIHHAVNLRKRAIEIIPSSRDSLASRYQEPFIFRNISMHGQYMFHAIDGVFCNNYYSLTSLNYSELVGHEAQEFRNLKHIRFAALDVIPEERLAVDLFSSSVDFVEASPCFPSMSVDTMLSRREPGAPSPRAVLVEGFPSGTYPSLEENPFASFLYDLYQRGIPAVLVARYGIAATQQAYAAYVIRGVEIPVLPLYGIIAETALPLLSIVIGSIDEKDWLSSADDKPLAVLRHRISALKTAIENLFRRWQNVISQELLEVGDRDRLYARLMAMQIRSKQATGTDLPRQRDLAVDSTEPEKPGDTYSAMAKNITSLFLEELTLPFERVGAGPDGLASLCNLGFRIGLDTVRSASAKERLPGGFRKFFDHEEDATRHNLLALANSVMSKVVIDLGRYGVRDVEVVPIEVHRDSAPGTGGRPRRFSFTVAVGRNGDVERVDERYSVMAFSADEAQFFELLSQGCSNDPEQVGRHLDGLRTRFQRLLVETWRCSTRRIDWFLMGAFKGVACGLAGFLRFDDLAVAAVRFRDTGHVSTLRQAVQLRPLVGDERSFVFEVWYSELLGARATLEPLDGTELQPARTVGERVASPPYHLE